MKEPVTTHCSACTIPGTSGKGWYDLSLDRCGVCGRPRPGLNSREPKEPSFIFTTKPDPTKTLRFPPELNHSGNWKVGQVYMLVQRSETEFALIPVNPDEDVA